MARSTASLCRSLPFAARCGRRGISLPQATPQQKKLAEIWADVLKLDQVGITDSIFELGADSLLIFRISARASREGLPIQTAQIFQHRTIANLTSALEQAATADTRNRIPPAHPFLLLPVKGFGGQKPDGKHNGKHNGKDHRPCRG